MKDNERKVILLEIFKPIFVEGLRKIDKNTAIHLERRVYLLILDKCI